MQFSAAFIAIVAALFSAPAFSTPLAGGQEVNLWNGEGVTTATVGLGSVLEARGGVCSGSSRCTNDQSLKNACAVAQSRLQSTTYTNGGE